MIDYKELNPTGEKLLDDIEANLQNTLKIANSLRAKYGKPMYITSGIRLLKYHLEIYRKKNEARVKAKLPELKIPMGSKHLSGEAFDVADTDGKLYAWCLQNIPLLEELGLYLEDRLDTPTWVHFQTRPPASGKRIFRA